MECMAFDPEEGIEGSYSCGAWNGGAPVELSTYGPGEVYARCLEEEWEWWEEETEGETEGENAVVPGE